MNRTTGATNSETVEAKAARLVERLRALQSTLVAFSGGVDSAVVAKAAHLALGERAVAATGLSASLAGGERETAEAVARQIGIRHEVVYTSEGRNPAYQQNNFDRCFHCKSDLYTHLEVLRSELALQTIASGANADDLRDFRPGMTAAERHGVCNPLAECGLPKDDVRQLARHWQLAVADKPAMPCLASRVAYGEEVTPERMAMIDAAEQFLRQYGLPICRVRYHRGELARIEVPLSALRRFSDDAFREQLTARLGELGFRFITLDLEGFRSGSLNVLAPEELTQF